MSKLAPCPTCQRHARVTDVECPFCGGSLQSVRPRLAQAPVGAKRAVMFAVGIAALPACGAEADDTGKQMQPIPSSMASQVASASASGSATTQPSTPPSSSAVPPPPSASGTLVQAPYGAPFPTNSQAVYGAPVPSLSASELQEMPVYGAPFEPLDRDAGGSVVSDASASPADGGSGGAPGDAGATDTPTEDTEPQAVPAYGIPPFPSP